MYKNLYCKVLRVNERIMWVEKWVAVILFAFLLFCLIAQVVARFILKVPAVWTEELARYSFIMTMWGSCGFTLYYGKHVEMNVIDTFLAKTKNPKRSFFIMEKITMVANMFFCGYFVSIYHPFLMKILKTGKMTTSIQVPMWIPMSAVEIGFVLMFIHALVIFLKPYTLGNQKTDVDV